MTGTVLRETLDGGIVRVTLNRPARLNAITPELLEDLIAATDAANADAATRCIVLTGAGRAFCSGDDLKEFESQASGEAETHAYVERIQDVTRALMHGRCPVVAAVRGWAVGGGLEWMINCDFAVASETARFFFSEVSWGLFVTGGVTALLPRLIGLQRTRALIMLGEKFTAAEALEWGLVYRVAADAALEAEALALARRIAALPPGPVAALRRALADRDWLDPAMAAETAATVAGFLDPATAKRIAGFS
ncbi:MAG: enoyl-CoA hydratase/isomerase family protein [Alphaproteobacteria bacterium]|nr:enoyl-CoA hydratase/isomerase family protein [Alphaproteobacteria bacterium]